MYLLQQMSSAAQVTEDQEESWASDPAAFLEDDDPDALTLRSACRALITDLQARPARNALDQAGML